MSLDPRLAALYAKLPTLECKRLCQRFCWGIIPVSAIELASLETKGKLATISDPKNLHLKVLRDLFQPRKCPVVVGTNCTRYEERPFMCRFWGSAESLPCPHGCVPSRWVSDEEGQEIYDEIARLSVRMEGK